MSITKDILQKNICYKLQLLQNLNINTVFKVTWPVFLRIREFTYTEIEIKNRKLFNKTKFTKFDIMFFKNNQNVILQLKKSKVEIKHIGMEIIITAINNCLFFVSIFCKLFIFKSQPNNAPLFS